MFVNFSIYLDPETGARLAKAAKRSGRTRNSVIGEAIQQWLERTGPTEWPRELLDAEPEDFEPFEALRPKGAQKPRFP